MEKQIKIAKTYRLLPETIEDIKKIKESFRKQRYEFSSDAAVIQYSVGIAKDFVDRVDNDRIHLDFTKEEIQKIRAWYSNYAFDELADPDDENLFQRILDSIK